MSLARMAVNALAVIGGIVLVLLVIGMMFRDNVEVEIVEDVIAKHLVEDTLCKQPKRREELYKSSVCAKKEEECKSILTAYCMSNHGIDVDPAAVPPADVTTTEAAE